MKIIGTAAIAALSGSALAGPALIDFDGLSAGTVVTNQYAGVTFGTDIADVEANDILTSSGLEISPPNTLRSASDGTISFTFSSLVTDVSLSAISVEDSSSVSYYRAGSLLFTDSRGGTGDFFIPQHYSYSDANGIDHVVVNAFDGGIGDAFVIDNVAYTIPAPGAAALFGLAGLGATRRRR